MIWGPAPTEGGHQPGREPCGSGASYGGEVGAPPQVAKAQAAGCGWLHINLVTAPTD